MTRSHNGTKCSTTVGGHKRSKKASKKHSLRKSMEKLTEEAVASILLPLRQDGLEARLGEKKVLFIYYLMPTQLSERVR